MNVLIHKDPTTTPLVSEIAKADLVIYTDKKTFTINKNRWGWQGSCKFSLSKLTKLIMNPRILHWSEL